MIVCSYRRTVAAISLILSLSVGSLPASALEFEFDQQQLDQAVGTPPQANSPTASHDLAIVRWLQQTRTPADIAVSWHLLEYNLQAFNTAVGGAFSEEDTPEFFKVFAQVHHLTNTQKKAYKDKFQRLRPFKSHGDIQLCVPEETSFSYPSGHATNGQVIALLLADLFPERAENILAVGQQFGFARVTCGVHYPSDVLAGQRLGGAIAQQLLASPLWQQIRQDLAPEVEAIRRQRPLGLPASLQGL